MADFEVRVYQARIEPHPNADAIELMCIGDYRSIVRKEQFQDGDHVAYIPEQSVLPEPLIEEMGLTGKLAGSHKNRVKAVRLCGVLSQGLVYPMPHRQLGDDVADELGIVKYLPPIPESMSGQVQHAPGQLIHYDIENIKKYPDAFIDGEDVVITEKVHGTQCQIGLYRGELVVASKGHAARDTAFKLNEANRGNIYVQQARQSEAAMATVQTRLEALTGQPQPTFYLLGEIYGAGVQDLKYDLDGKGFRVFDLYLGERHDGRFLDHQQMTDALDGLFDTVPLLYRGPYSREIVAELSTGQSTIAAHVREGVVVKTAVERSDLQLERIILKSVSDDYLLRKGNTTEFE